MANLVIQGDSQKVLSHIKNNHVDLVVTSPPYDNLRSYNETKWNFNIFKTIANELYRVLKPGGVVVWIVGDATTKGSESGSSFKQALYFKEIGLNLHDTMIWEKHTSSFPSGSKSLRYTNIFEYMFILSNRKPKTVNLIRDKPNKYAGHTYWGNVSTMTQIDNQDIRISNDRSNVRIADFGIRNNIWQCPSATTVSKDEKFIRGHPAIFPESLVHDHIQSWSNENDIVLDPFAGSGTTLKVAAQMNRQFIGIELNPNYLDIIENRLDVNNIEFDSKSF